MYYEEQILLFILFCLIYFNNVVKPKISPVLLSLAAAVVIWATTLFTLLELDSLTDPDIEPVVRLHCISESLGSCL